MDFLTDLGIGMPQRPKKRRDPLPETHIFQLRIDLVGARPPIWRRIEIRSDASLWTLHRVIQGAFDWFDAHLYLFSLGHPHSWESELFLCDFDMTEGEEEGTFVGEVRVDETLQASGDLLEYLYDYGDNWHLKIKLEKLLPTSPDGPIAVCTAGRRASPPEDSGGMADADSLSEFMDDPTFFDIDETNERIGGWLETPQGFAPAVAMPDASGAAQEELTQLLRFPQFRHILEYCYQPETRFEITRRLQDLEPPSKAVTNDPAQDDATRRESLSAVQLLMDEVGDGVRLTGAGYLPPKIAYRVGEELGLDGIWLSSGGESKMLAVMEFREILQQLGLLRKHKGDLVPTKAGKATREDPQLLWDHLASRLLPRDPSGRTFAHDAGLLTLLFAATSHGDFGLDLAAGVMTESGWRVNSTNVEYHDVVFQGARQAILLWHIAPKDQRSWFSKTVSPVASELARTALLRMKPASAG